MITSNLPLLSEILRPKNLGELNLPDSLVNSLTRQAESGTIMNMIFYGSPGIGKTSAAKILIKDLDADVKEINGSINNGDKSLVKQIEAFSSSVSLLGRPKICFIDEADYLPKAVQEPLRYIIENVSGNTRFILTANNIEKLSPAIKSRCLPICFDVSRKDAGQVIDKMVGRYEEKLASLGVNPDPVRVREIVSIYFPDLRNISNHFQIEFS